MRGGTLDTGCWSVVKGVNKWQLWLNISGEDYRGRSIGDRIRNHQQVDPLDRKNGVDCIFMHPRDRRREGSQQWFENFVFWKSDSLLSYVSYGTIYEDPDCSSAARLFFTSSMLLSPIGSSERSRCIQYLSRDLRKISVLSRCGLRLMNSKIWTFTSVLECEWWAKCLPTQVKGFAKKTKKKQKKTLIKKN